MRIDRRSVIACPVALAAAVGRLKLFTPAPVRPKPTPAAPAIRFATDWRAEAEHGGFYRGAGDRRVRPARAGRDSIMQGGPGVSVPEPDLAAGARSRWASAPTALA